MTPQRFEQVKCVFAAACGLDAAARIAYLDEACAGHADLRAQVEALLAQDGKSLPLPNIVPAAAVWEWGRSETKRCETSAAANSNSPAVGTDPRPIRIGQFRILSRIGAGGMGVVYEAEQDNPRRSVALKVIRSEVTSSQALWRFRLEAQVLGRLQHPGVAQIYEAGAAEIETPAGLKIEQPYFAMEYVHGRPLTQFASQQRLGTGARLELVARICDAVQHAHQQGVIHRDLKPGNILVDASGQPKILDFGVARLTDADVRATTLHTSTGQLVGTLPYMSPEQVLGDPGAVDTRADVYALGVLCYELLTGRIPIESSAQSVPRAARAILEDEPRPLIACNPAFRGDLTTIVTKALEKDKARRYQSASELAADLRRYLADEPIRARPATTFYRLRKFARRNKPLVIGVAATFGALVIGIIGTTSQAITATRARNRALDAERLAERRRIEAEQQRAEAERQAAIAQAVNDFLNNDLLAAAHPERQKGRDVTVRHVLDQAAQTIEGRFADQPLVEAAIRQTLGEAYHGLGAHEPAATHFERALSLRRTALGDADQLTALAMGRLGVTRMAMGQFAQAETLLVTALDLRQRALGEHDSRTLASMNHLALLYERQGRFQEQEKLLKRVLEHSSATCGENGKSIQAALSNLGDLYAERGRGDEAEPLLTQALELALRMYGAEHPETLITLNSLGKLHIEQGRYAEAESLCRRALEGRRRVLGDEHPRTLSSLNTLAVLYKRQARYAEAEPLYVETLAIKRRILGTEHPDTLVSLNNLGSLYATAGRYGDAEPLFLEALAARRRGLGDDHPATLSSLRNLADLYRLMTRFEDAQPLAHEHFERTARARGPDHADTHAAIEFLAALYDSAGRSEESARWRARLPTSQPAE